VDQLVEDAELVADAIADRGDRERGERVHVAGREPAEPAVAEAGLLLLREDAVEVVAELRHRLARLVLEAHAQQVVGEVRAEQELRRQVDDRAARLLVVGLARPHRAAQHLAPRREREGEIEVVGRGALGEAPEHREQRFLELALDGLDERPVHDSSEAARRAAGRLRRISEIRPRVASSLHAFVERTSGEPERAVALRLLFDQTWRGHCSTPS
jgi:hypothetical protein